MNDEIRINVPEGMEIDKENSTFECIKFKPKKKELPKTWKEFCDNNPIKDREFFINDNSDIKKINKSYRNDVIDANLLSSEEYAEAMLALCKLIQLRDCYNDGWKPDWKDASPKHIIRVYSGILIADTVSGTQGLLAFKTPMLRNVFLNNFRDLIEQAKLLL